VKPYRYARTFQSVATEIPVAEMDKDVLEVYIRGILGAKAQKGSSAGASAKADLVTHQTN